MRKRAPSSQYFLTKDKKLEIHEDDQIFRAKIPVRFFLNPLDFLKNIFFIISKSKKRLRPYSVKDLKDQKIKTLHLAHFEIQQVWNHPIKDKLPAAKPANKMKTKTKNKK
jgi:hypothetical protein